MYDSSSDSSMNLPTPRSLVKLDLVKVGLICQPDSDPIVNFIKVYNPNLEKLVG